MGGGMSSSNEYPFALVAWLATGVLSGFGCGVRRIRMKARKIPANEEKKNEPPRGFLKQFRPDFARVHLSSSRWPSTRTTSTFHLLSGARLLRPPVPLPVIAKNAGVVDLGGITPDASARDCV